MLRTMILLIALGLTLTATMEGIALLASVFMGGW